MDEIKKVLFKGDTQFVSNELIFSMNKIVLFYIYLLSPIISFIYSLFTLKNKYSRYIIALFYILFSYCITFDFSRYVDLDGYRHALMYEQSDINILIYNIKTSLLLGVADNQWNYDIFINIIALIAKLFNGSYHLFFLLAGIFYTVFFIKSLSIVVDRIKKTEYLLFISLLIPFFLTYPIFHIQAVRFSCAFWFSVWCTLKLFTENNKKYLWICLLATQIHFSFWFYCIMLIGAYYTQNKLKYYSIFAVISIFFTVIPFGFIESFAAYLPDALSSKVLAYGQVERTKEITSAIQDSNFIKYFKYAQKIVYIFILYYLLKFKDVICLRNQGGLLTLYLIIFSICNILSLIPDFQRFKFLLNPFILVLIPLIPISKGLKLVIFFFMFSYIFSIYQEITRWIFVLPTNFFFSNIFDILFNL